MLKIFVLQKLKKFCYFYFFHPVIKYTCKAKSLDKQMKGWYNCHEKKLY